MASTVQIVGLKEANAALRRLPEFARDDSQGEMDVTAFHVTREASAKAPRSADGSHGHPPGFMASSIAWESRPRSLSAVVGVRPAAYYWRFVEFGTARVAPRPFLRPTVDSNREDHHSRLLKALERSAVKVERAAK